MSDFWAMKQFVKPIIYFLLSTVITYIFIAANTVYDTLSFRLLALTIAGLVWGLQVAGAFLLPDNKRRIFLEEAGKVCLFGSLVLMISVLVNFLWISAPQARLYSSAINVLLSVLLMAIMFSAFLKRLKLSNRRLWFWLLCLCAAVPTQAWLVGIL